jgi:hypothetical protein
MTQRDAAIGDDVRNKYEWVARYLSEHVADHWHASL